MCGGTCRGWCFFTTKDKHDKNNIFQYIFIRISDNFKLAKKKYGAQEGGCTSTAGRGGVDAAKKKKRQQKSTFIKFAGREPGNHVGEKAAGG